MGGIVGQYHVAILTVENDLHALAMQKAFESYSDVVCRVVETDRCCNSSGLSWSNVAHPDLACTLPARGGELFEVSQLDVIWWRRINSPQKVPPYITDPSHIDVINNDCRTALLGIVLNEFKGTWINEPSATRLAENKLLQLHAAQRAGLQIPRTLVSQDPIKIRRFCAMLENKVVVKPVRGTRGLHLFAQMLAEEHLADDDSLRLCPAIYQEHVPGNRHIRAHCFGDAVHAVLIESEDLDWRRNLDIPFRVFHLAEDVKERLRNVLGILGLKMGVIDLKLVRETEPVWLEINPQGQFLFVEGLSGLDLTSAFTDFIYQEAKRAARSRK